MCCSRDAVFARRGRLGLICAQAQWAGTAHGRQPSTGCCAMCVADRRGRRAVRPAGMLPTARLSSRLCVATKMRQLYAAAMCVTTALCGPARPAWGRRVWPVGSLRRWRRLGAAAAVDTSCCCTATEQGSNKGRQAVERVFTGQGVPSRHGVYGVQCGTASPPRLLWLLFLLVQQIVPACRALACW